MARDIVDDRLIGALHLRALTHHGLEHDPVSEHLAVQAGTIDALLAGNYEGDATLDEIMRLGDVGVGTVQQLDGELIILDGEAWLARADGSVVRLPGSTRTPFAVVTRFVVSASEEITEPLTVEQLQAKFDALAPKNSPIVAVKVHGEFANLRLRSVHRQEPPYPPLSDVVAHQVEWSVDHSIGTLVGFKFPDATSGVEVPGFHLHYLSDDRQVGGHVLTLTCESGRIEIDPCDTLHVELPPGVELGTPGTTAKEDITRLESLPEA